MRSENDITQDMQRVNDTRKVLEQQKESWKGMVGKGDDNEVAKALKFTTLALNRCERTLNRLNRELGKHIGDKKRDE